MPYFNNSIIKKSFPDFPDVQLAVTSLSVSQEYSGASRVDVSLLAVGPFDQIENALLAEEWRSAADSPPANDDDVLACLDGDVVIASYWGNGEWSVSPSPTHWMPVPQAPRRVAERKKRALSSRRKT